MVNLSTLLYGDLAMVKASPRTTVYSEPGSGSVPASGRMVTCYMFYLLQDLKTRGKHSIWSTGISIALQINSKAKKGNHNYQTAPLVTHPPKGM